MRATKLLVLLLAATLAACQQATSSQPDTSSPSTSASPSAAASTADMTVVLTGSFHDVDDTAKGTVQLVRLADGGYEVAFEDFTIAATTNLKVYLVKNRDVTASTDVTPDDAIDLGALKGTSGMQVYSFPQEMNADVMTYHTVVIWDAPMGHAIAAAPLGQP